MDAPDEILATLRPAPGRWALALAVLFGLGGLLVLLALTAALGAGARVAILAIALLVLVQGERVRRTGSQEVRLTREGLTDGVGAQVAPLERIRSVDRGLFAFKPSNGFAVVLDRPLGRAWTPGLWWRVGRRVGVGGLVSSGEARALADRLALLLDERGPR
ncbi:hypothetical protein [Histidinibacterium aquaticum]|uniref:DUF2244 domain-containing protein n=1 Tax=Histidinibacterium aquaticum TaxID=2613962 RepID=A0A5J5GPJ5_9RHOB|nr:hypothetical protein [Histidinibacterium aquaticum]KAA9010259.1 hypothetical protein F3S47_03135 [Histidinibacterium aquaticum]